MKLGKARTFVILLVVCLPLAWLVWRSYLTDEAWRYERRAREALRYERLARRVATDERASLDRLCALVHAEAGHFVFSAETICRNGTQFNHNGHWREHSSRRPLSMEDLLEATGLSKELFAEYTDLLDKTNAIELRTRGGGEFELELSSTNWFYGVARNLVYLGTAKLPSTHRDEHYFKPMPAPGWYYENLPF